MNQHQDRSPNAARVVAVAALLLVCSLPAHAQRRQPAAAAPDGGDGISVAGSGEAKGKPSAVEINATVSGDAELAADAIVKYRDAKRRAVEALEGLKLEGLKIESGGFAINQGMDAAQQQAMMQGNAVAGTGKQRVTVTEQLKVVLGGLDKLKDEELMDTVLKVVDTGRDGGLEIGPRQPRNYYEMQMFYNSGQGNSNLVAFVIPDAESLREQAYKAAMADARRRAERLATLAGVKLGRIVSVHDQGAAAPKGNAQMAAMYGFPPPAAGGDAEELSSGVFSEIPVRVNLAVQFEIGAGEAPQTDMGDADADGVHDAKTVAIDGIDATGVETEIELLKKRSVEPVAEAGTPRQAALDEARTEREALKASNGIEAQRKRIAEQQDGVPAKAEKAQDSDEKQ